MKLSARLKGKVKRVKYSTCPKIYPNRKVRTFFCQTGSSQFLRDCRHLVHQQNDVRKDDVKKNDVRKDDVKKSDVGKDDARKK